MTAKTYATVLTEVDGPVGIITMNQPERLNPLDPPTSERDIHDAFMDMHADPDVRVVILTGAGRAFCAGADLRLKKDAESAKEHDNAGPGRLAYGYPYGLMWQTLHEFRKPTIAAVNGYALGGGWELAHMMDFIVAGESAVFSAAEIEVGLHPFASTTNYLPKMVGKHLAMEIVLSGRKLNAKECLELRLLNKVVPDADLLTEAKTLARQIAARPPITVAFAKKLMNRAMNVMEDYELERALAYYLHTMDDTRAAWAAAAARAPLPEFHGH